MGADIIRYKKGGERRPANGFKEKFSLKLNGIPFLRNFFLVKKFVCKAFDLPESTSINKDFYSSSPNLVVGENVGLADTFIIAYAPVTIEEGCSFSFRNMLITSTHDYDDFATIVAKPIKIGKNVWVTTNVTILPGVTIGNNTVIGAGSVVTKDIPSGVFAAGNPCKVVRKINFKK
ncbi:acyltransferase [Saccharicrinis sp. 156]|uniref:acyltransferase n=1 Tax=Saccharicrinis sp. 156 TaxID=3417574 RepID=UPI003D3542C9